MDKPQNEINHEGKPELESGLRYVYGFFLGLIGFSLVEISLADTGWGFWNFFWAILGFLVFIKSVRMMIELAKIVVYVVLVVAAIGLIVSIFSNIQLTTPLAVVIAGVIIAIAINNKN